MVFSSLSWVDVAQLIVLPILLPAAIGWITGNTNMPTFWKRLSLGGLTLAGVVITNLVEASVSGVPWDIGLGVAQWLAVWLFAELAYYGILKAPIIKPEPTVISIEPLNLSGSETKANLMAMVEAKTGELPSSKVSKAELIDALIPVAEVTTVSEPVSIASIIKDNALGKKAV